MARSRFGGTSVDWLFAPYTFGGTTLVALHTGTTLLNFYSAQTAGTHYTDLLDADGNPVTQVTVSGHQVPEFDGPDGVPALWADKGDGSPREYMATTDTASVADAVVDAEAARDAAVAATSSKANWAALPINVLDPAYGLSGTTDNTVAIQAALTAAATAGRPVRFPQRPNADPYVITLPGGQDYMLRAAAGQVLLGDPGATIKVKSGAGDYRAIFAGATISTDLSGLVLDGLTIDQNSGGNAVTNTTTLLSTYQRYVLYVPVGSGIVVRNCKVKGIDSINTLALAGPAVEDVRVQDNIFEFSSGTTLHDHSTLYISASSQVITGNVFMGVAGGLGVTTAIETHGAHQVVTGNLIRDYYAGMNITGVTAAGSDNIVVIGNNILDVLVGIDIWSYTSSGSTGIRGCTVANNVIQIERDLWLTKGGASAYPRGIMIDPTATTHYEQLRIAGNLIRFNPFTGTAIAGELQAAGISLWLASASYELRNLDIYDNTIVGSLSTGIRVAATIRRGKIARNRIVDPGSGTEGAMNSAYKGGMTIVGDVQDLIVENNDTFDTRGTHLIAQGIWTSVGTATRCTQRNNSVTCIDGTVLVSFVQTVGKLFANPGEQPVAPRFHTGLYYSPPGVRGTVTQTQDSLTAIPFWVATTTAFDRIAAEVTAAVASTTVRLGIYADAGDGTPGSLIVDAGTIDGNSATAQEITISQTLQPGLYWLAAVSHGGTPTVRTVTTYSLGSAGVSSLANIAGASPRLGYSMSGQSGALPATYVQNGQSAAPTLVVLRAA